MTLEAQDTKLKCADCGDDFTFSSHMQTVFADKGWRPPKRCTPCRNNSRGVAKFKDVPGVVKMFDSGKGYGFITPTNGGQDAFAHFSQINSKDQHRDLVAGQRVIFDLTEGRGGKPAAANVRVVEG